MRHEEKVGCCNDGRKDVLRHHHLWAGEAGVEVRRAENVVLCCVCETV